MKKSAKKRVSCVVGSIGLGVMVLAPTAPAMAVCDPASTDPSCPIGQLSLTNPANPASPLNPSNPANPSSLLNPSNPANPASPLNPANQWANNPANPANPLGFNNPAGPNDQQPTVFNPGGILSGAYSGAGLCQLGDAVCPDPHPARTAYPTESYPNVPRRHHRYHRRHVY